MTADRWARIDTLLAAALVRPPAGRERFVREACGDDVALGDEVLSLLAHAASADGFLEPAPAAPPASLAAGQTLGAYTVAELIGAGGMGEVYRAHDPRLGREVALKILPPQLAADAERLRRFEQEARAAAALTHPNIVTIYSVEQAGELRFLTMELVEGAPMDKRIPGDGLDIDRLLAIAVQLADAIGTAHVRGIVHRDLKPANVMVTPDGRVKILDFGLAKLKPLSGAAELTTASPDQTGEGRLLGTVTYMSPEQAEGREIDHRSDIFSFGVLLYELATGRRPFTGDSSAAVLSSILRDTPPSITELKAACPPELARIVRRCLVKDPGRRYQSAIDVRNDVQMVQEELAAGTTQSVVPRIGARGAHVRWKLAAAVLSISLLASIGLLAWALTMRSRVGASAPVHSHVDLSPAEGFRGIRPDELTVGGGRPSSRVIAVAPDGGSVAFAGTRDGVQQLFLRVLNRDEATPLAGTEGASQPFFSPDGRRIGFWQGAKLRWIPAEGGTPVDLCDAALVFGASWGHDGAIVFGTDEGLKKVPASGGKPELLSATNARGGPLFLFPDVLPGGEAVLYSFPQSAFHYDMAVATLSLKTGKSQVLIEDAADARYVPELRSVVYARAGKLMAAPFDAAQAHLTGREVGVLDSVLQELNGRNNFYRTGLAQYAFSDTGVLAYVAGGIHRDLTNSLVWVDLATQKTEALGAPRKAYLRPRLSPDAQRVVDTTTGMVPGITTTSNVVSGIWVYDRIRDDTKQLPFEGRTSFALWNPKGDRVVFSGYGKNIPFELYSVAADGSASAERLTVGGHGPVAASWTRDGDLIFVGSTRQTSNDVFLLSMTNRQFHGLLATNADEAYPDLSPDGHWLAYCTRDQDRLADQYEVWVSPYPALNERFPVSTRGGTAPRWVRGGHELLYLESAGSGRVRVMRVSISTTPTFKAGPPHPVWEGPLTTLGGTASVAGFDPTPDGRRLLAATREDPNPPPPKVINLVVNWFDELRAKLQAGR